MSACTHPDVRAFDGLRCCLSCGEALIHDDLQIDDGIRDKKTAKYQYDPLTYDVGQEIRLLVLHPGAESDAIRCDIAHANLLESPRYEAVSYTWATANGDASLSGVVLCGAKEIAVTRNCESVLRHLRQRHRKRVLWIDAICIDQSNMVERSHQVRLMARIYSEASQVFAYLGSGQRGLPQRTAVKRVLDYLEAAPNAKFAKRRPSRTEVTLFLNLRYFDRVWVLQEIALAKMVTLIAGDRTIHWTAGTVRKLLSLCSSLNVTPPSMLQWLPCRRPEEEDLLDVLRRSRNCSANDERDKVFALLGLVGEQHARTISVDYTKSTLQVYVDFAISMMREGRTDILVHNASQWVNAGFESSWIPLWHVKCVYEPFPAQFPSSLVDQLAIAWFESQTDMPRFLHKATSNQQKPPQDFRFVITYSKPSTSFGLPALALPCLKIRAHFLDTIIRTSVDPIPIDMKSYDLPLVYNDTKLCSKCSEEQKALPTIPDPPDRREAFESAINKAGAGMIPFFTERSIGFANVWRPRELYVVGDTIWALAGMAVPVILRRNEGHYFLVGECHLYRAALPHLCASCGAEARPWPMVSEVISIR